MHLPQLCPHSILIGVLSYINEYLCNCSNDVLSQHNLKLKALTHTSILQQSICICLEYVAICHLAIKLDLFVYLIWYIAYTLDIYTMQVWPCLCLLNGQCWDGPNNIMSYLYIIIIMLHIVWEHCVTLLVIIITWRFIGLIEWVIPHNLSLDSIVIFWLIEMSVYVKKWGLHDSHDSLLNSMNMIWKYFIFGLWEW